MAFHYVARGVITSGDSILLVRAIGDTMTFLPGGHIEFAEPAKAALQRELMEEASIDGVVGILSERQKMNGRRAVSSMPRLTCFFMSIPHCQQTGRFRLTSPILSFYGLRSMRLKPITFIRLLFAS